MKKLLIATVIAVSTSTTAYAAPVNITYDVEVAGNVYLENVGPLGTFSGYGSAIITIDIDDFSQNGLFNMAFVNTIISSNPIMPSDTMTIDIAGVFDGMGYWDTGEMNFVGGSAQAMFSTCGPLMLPLPCDEWEGSFIIDAGSTVVTGPGDIVEFRQTVVDSDMPFSDVTAISDFTLTLVSTEPVNPVPVPAAAWLFGSALVGLAGIGRKRKTA